MLVAPKGAGRNLAWMWFGSRSKLHSSMLFMGLDIIHFVIINGHKRILFFEIHAEFAQKVVIFLNETFCAVVLLLVFYVFDDIGNM
jgi:hypothetical protein